MRKLPSGALEDPESTCPYGPQNHPLPEFKLKVDMSLHERKDNEEEEVQDLVRQATRSKHK